MSAESRVVAVQPKQDVQAYAPPMSVESLLERREIIKQAIDQVMVADLHYGVIPGTQGRLSLLKEGAEVLAAMFRIAVEPVVTDLCTPNEVRFKVECRGSVNGQYVGSGIGICSSNEEKYRWRKPRSKAEYDKAEGSLKRLKYGTDRNGHEFEEPQVRQSPYDAIQTILSMAEKRAKVDMVKTVLAASECLKQRQAAKPSWKDHKRDNGQGQRPAQTTAKSAGTSSGAKSADVSRPASTGASAPQASSSAASSEPAKEEAPALISEEQVERICKILDSNGIPDNAFLAQFELGIVAELEASRYDAALLWLDRNSA
jgi:hypothetical protein